MPFENPEPGRYWGYRCVKCQEAIALSPYSERSGWRGSGSFTLDCMNWDCQFQAEYPLAEIRVLEITPATVRQTDNRDQLAIFTAGTFAGTP